MEAKDTVMKVEELATYFTKSLHSMPFYEERDIRSVALMVSNIVEAQAEMSFKAGLEKGVVMVNAANAGNLARMRQAGIKEVVDCANEGKITTDVFQEDGSLILRKGDIVIPQLYWQAKLKEWGIDGH